MFFSTSTPLRTPNKDRNANNSGSDKGNDNSSDFSHTFPYPACWKDDARMLVLLAPFRIREVNPENYDSKLKFWQDMIALYCEHSGTGCFCKRDLQHTFARGDRIPYGFDTVFSEMLHAKKIRTRADFEYDPEDTWSGWAMNSFVKRPISWGWQTLKGKLGLQAENDAGLLEYVHLEVMKVGEYQEYYNFMHIYIIIIIEIL